MRQNPNHKRPRNRGNLGRKPSNNRNQTFDSNGPSVRIRGNAFQVHEKYLTLARDAYSSGDRVMAENYFQHAEHYYRIVNATTDPASGGPRLNGQANGYHGGMDDDDYEDTDEFGRPMNPHGYSMRPRHDGGGERNQQPAQQDSGQDEDDGEGGGEGEGERQAERSDDRQGERQGDRQGDRGERRRRGRRPNGHDRGEDGGRTAELAPAAQTAPQAEAPRAEPAAAQAPQGEGHEQAADRPRRRRRRPPAEGAGEAPGRDVDEEPVLL